MLNIPIFSHPEEPNLSEAGVMNEGYVSTILGLKGVPHQAEEIIVSRDIELARDFGSVHITHISTSGSVELIRQAKKNKVPVTCDVAIHHLVLTDDAVHGYDSLNKVNPPLRTQRDIKALIEGLNDGTIDAIVSDHAPHSAEEKIVEFNQAAFGMIGLETLLSLLLTEIVDKKKLPLLLALKKLTVNSASILKLKNKGRIKNGFDADLTIFDPKKKWTVDINSFKSKSKNSPFNGWKLNGKVIYTIVGGKIVYQETVNQDKSS
jgi:dihydroorotase